MSSEVKTQISFKCDGPKCEHPTISYIQEQIAKDPEALPDDLFRVIEVRHYDETAKGFVVHGFLNWDCVRQWGKSYVPPRSPRELSKILANNEAIEAAKNQTLAADVAESQEPALQELEPQVTFVSSNIEHLG